MSSAPTTSKSAAPEGWPGPDPEQFLYPWNFPPLIGYLRAVREHFAYAKFLGLPKIKDEPDIPLRNLYVEPTVSPTYISPDTSPEYWPDNRTSVLRALLDTGRLVLLGDPGSGKSTLVSWISCQLAEPMGSLWTKYLDHSVPLPFIVRDLDITRDITWETLLARFLAQRPGKSLAGHRDVVEDLLARGQALILVDGLDEIGDIEVLRTLRNALFEGLSRYPECRWLVTSRIVGYDRVPFHAVRPNAPDGDNSFENLILAAPEATPTLGEKNHDLMLHDESGQFLARTITVFHVLNRQYLAPFDDKQIAEFAQNWWLSHERSEDAADGEAGDLVKAVHDHPGTERLARIPNLLTMMALIHRTRAQLPHGRANLYEDIAQAYLHTIDAFRKIDHFEYHYEDKRYWLAKVGYEMQRQRSQAEGEKEILAREQEIVSWIVSAMDEYGCDRNDAGREARAFLDLVTRRSGLLIPRSEGYFAFVHLSFQEFFAAVYLDEQVQGGLVPDLNLITKSGPGPGAPLDGGLFASFAREVTWREPLLLLFERLPKARRTPDKLAEALFASATFRPFGNATLPDSSAHKTDEALVQLLASVSIDPYSHLSIEKRTEAWHACWSWVLDLQHSGDWQEKIERVSQILLSASPYYERAVFGALEKTWRVGKFHELHLFDVHTLPTLTELEGLQTLDLFHCSDLTNLTPLGGLKVLRLALCGGMMDLAPLNGLKSLQTLYIFDCAVGADIAPLSNLKALESLMLSGCTGLEDFAPLSNLKNLVFLDLSNCRGLLELVPLRNLNALRSLDLSGCIGVKEVAPISELNALNTLRLKRTGVTNLAPLSGLKELILLDLTDCAGVTDLSPLFALKKMQLLDLNGCTGVSEVPECLRNRPNLKILGP